jgi:MMP 1-O-methyltransferase
MFNFARDISVVPGWLTKKESEFLYNQAKKVSGKNAIVEIGSWKGRSTVCLGIGVKEGNKAKIYAIDPHSDSLYEWWVGAERKNIPDKSKVKNNYQIFLANIKKAGVGKHISPIRKTSNEAASDFQKPIEMLFIDGSHNFFDVKLDYKLWFPKLMNKGTIAFHDAWHSLGVLAVTTYIMLTSTKIRHPRLIDTIIAFQKVDKNSFFERLGNFLFIFYRLFFGWIGSVNMHVLGGTNEASTLDKRGMLVLKNVFSKF